jgi:hypothetical protein
LVEPPLLAVGQLADAPAVQRVESFQGADAKERTRARTEA